jgi:hypothetical protein
VLDSQNAFAEGYQILGLVLIANEFLDCRIWTSTPWVICKLDIGKEYDHANWDCLFFMVKRVGFGEKWRKWVWYFVFEFQWFGFKLWLMDW